MRLTIATILIVILIVICSIFVVNVTNLVSIDSNIIDKLNVDDKANYKISYKDLQLDDSADHLMWFLQISDLHISKFKDPSRISHLREFCSKTVDVIKPSAVLASGDLTDAKTKDMLGSRQFAEEWTSYYSVLKDTQVMNKTVWLDIRGNHDNFNIPKLHAPEDMFVRNSAQGSTHKRSYLHQIKKGSETYSFIAVDACLNPGPKRPFNFIGLLSVNDTEELINLAEKSRELGGNYTIWFGHYPTTSILYPSTIGIRSIIGRYRESLAYLCGHFHRIGGLIPNMYTRHDEGFLELELGDWMKNRIYRLGAIDHGLFTFIDTRHNEWPVVLITNPKNVLFNNPERENSKLQLESSHIRLLAFSPSTIVDCQIKIDKGEWQKCTQIDDRLFVLKWNPDIYRRNLHMIEVIVRDADGHTKIVEQSFALDKTELSFDLLGSWILMNDMNKTWQGLFGVALCLCVVPLCSLRIWHILVRRGKVQKPRLRRFYCMKYWVQKMWILSTVDRLAIPIVSYSFYLIIGPWCFVEVIDGHMGVVFVWGIFVNGSFIPGTLQYLYGFCQLMLCQFALINVFANNTYKRFKYHLNVENTKISIWTKIYKNLPFILIMAVELLLAYIMWFNYGMLAFILAPMRTWSIIMNILIWYHSKNIPNKCLRSAAAVWSSEAKMVSSSQSN